MFIERRPRVCEVLEGAFCGCFCLWLITCSRVSLDTKFTLGSLSISQESLSPEEILFQLTVSRILTVKCPKIWNLSHKLEQF